MIEPVNPHITVLREEYEVSNGGEHRITTGVIWNRYETLDAYSKNRNKPVRVHKRLRILSQFMSHSYTYTGLGHFQYYH